MNSTRSSPIHNETLDSANGPHGFLIGGIMVWYTRLLEIILFATVVTITACATGPAIQTYWVNPQFEPGVQQQQFTLDSTECAALANQLIPELPSPPKSRSGTVTLNTPRGPLHGTYQDQPSYEGGFLAGWQRSERERARNDYAAACMAKRGWKQRIVGQ